MTGKRWSGEKLRVQANVTMKPVWAHVCANNRKGCMAIVSGGIMDHTVTSSVLNKKGLLSMTDHCRSAYFYLVSNRRMPNGTYGGERGGN